MVLICIEGRVCPVRITKCLNKIIITLFFSCDFCGRVWCLMWYQRSGCLQIFFKSPDERRNQSQNGKNTDNVKKVPFYSLLTAKNTNGADLKKRHHLKLCDQYSQPQFSCAFDKHSSLNSLASDRYFWQLWHEGYYITLSPGFLHGNYS